MSWFATQLATQLATQDLKSCVANLWESRFCEMRNRKNVNSEVSKSRKCKIANSKICSLRVGAFPKPRSASYAQTTTRQRERPLKRPKITNKKQTTLWDRPFFQGKKTEDGFSSREKRRFFSTPCKRFFAQDLVLSRVRTGAPFSRGNPKHCAHLAHEKPRKVLENGGYTPFSEVQV